MADVCKESNNEKYKICLLGIEVRRSVSENEQKIEFSNGRCLLYYKSANFRFCPHSVFMCFVWIWEQTAIISLYSINGQVFITETECVYCEVRAEYTVYNRTFIKGLTFATGTIQNLLRLERMFVTADLHSAFYRPSTNVNQSEQWNLRSCSRMQGNGG